MKMNRNFVVYIATAMLPVMAGLTTFQTVQAAPAGYVNPETERVVEYWTKGRRANAIPRDLVIDPRGLGYLRKPDGSLQPYGHQIVANAQSQGPAPLAKPGGGSMGDTVPPAISNMDPNGTSIGASYTFSATVTDTSGVRSVSFVIQYPDNVTTQSFSATQQSGTDTWQVSLQGFSDGNWSWWVVAKDAAPKGGNTATSNNAVFTVDTGGGSSSGGGGGSSGDTTSGTVTNAMWNDGGAVQIAAGRLYFEMPSNAKWKGPWTGYVCSGTVVNDETTGRSIILTASHCVYDDANKAFARNVLFIPDQADTTGAGTDLNCSNDPLGCWTPSFGVVDVNWTTRTFPDNIPWDYAFYVVSDSGSHVGKSAPSGELDKAVAPLTIEFQAPCHDAQSTGDTCDDFTHALGYSYSDDPKFMYCAEDMTTEGAYGDWWLSSCGLSGGSSGGPWMQPVNSGNGPVISVNSWGYTNSPGMAGPRLSETSASCVFTAAKTEPFLSTADGYAGVKETCP
jgi:hypothetical protein